MNCAICEDITTREEGVCKPCFDKVVACVMLIADDNQEMLKSIDPHIKAMAMLIYRKEIDNLAQT